MSRLHILNKTDCETAAATELLRALQPGDTVMLIENAVVLGIDGSDFAEDVAAVADTRLVALQEDCALRGISPACACTDYRGFVALTGECRQSISWF